MTSWQPDLRRASGPRYLAIAAAIGSDLEKGRLRPGDRLPTHREMADRLGVSVGTITRAYAEAMRRGLVRGEVGRGTFVRGPGDGAALPSAAEPPGFIDLSLNLPVLPVAEDGARTLRRALADLRGRADLGDLLRYQPPAGALRHREAGAAWVARSGIPAEPDRILVCSGVQHAMLVTISSLLQPGDTLLVEELTYPGILALAGLLRVRLKGVPIDRDGIVPDALAAACRGRAPRALYCVPTIQNPTASVMPEARRREIAGVCRAHGVAVIEDDCYGLLPPERPRPLAAFYPENSFHLVSLAKTLAPGLRIGYLLAPLAAVDRLAGAIRATTWMAAPLLAEIAGTWIQGGTAARLLGRTRRELAARQQTAARVLKEGRIDTHPFSPHLWLHLAGPWRRQEFTLQARRRGVGISPAEAFWAGRGDPPDAVRLCLGAAADRGSLERGLRTLQGVLGGSATAYHAVL